MQFYNRFQIYTSPQLALISTCVVPCVAGIAIVYGRYVRKITRSLLDKLADISKSAEERLGNVKTVKTFSRENEECKTYDNLLGEALQLGYKETLARAMFFGTVIMFLFKKLRTEPILWEITYFNYLFFSFNSSTF